MCPLNQLHLPLLTRESLISISPLLPPPPLLSASAGATTKAAQPRRPILTTLATQCAGTTLARHCAYTTLALHYTHLYLQRILHSALAVPKLHCIVIAYNWPSFKVAMNIIQQYAEYLQQYSLGALLHTDGDHLLIGVSCPVPCVIGCHIERCRSWWSKYSTEISVHTLSVARLLSILPICGPPHQV